MIKYYRLLDRINYNEIIKCENDVCYRYSYGINRWVHTSLFAKYEKESSKSFKNYEVLSDKDYESVIKPIIEENSKWYKKMYKMAEELAMKNHEGQVDKAGKPYMEHIMSVVLSLNDREHQIVGMLHDICEDTPVTPEDLTDYGFSERIVKSVRVITKDKDTPYMEYIKKVKTDEAACEVKKADLRNNMCLSRIKNPTEEDYQRTEKYRKALEFLEDVDSLYKK